MKSGTKCRTIVDTLSDEIAAGRYRAPSSFPSVERIIRRFKVSYATAVKALDEMKERGIDFISLVAPTSSGRIAKIAKEAEGFLYIVSSLGVTGTRGAIATDIGEIVAAVRAVSDIPCAVGFGISTPAQAAKMAAASDGAIVGSAIVKLIAAHGREAPAVVGEYVRGMVAAVKGA